MGFFNIQTPPPPEPMTTHRPQDTDLYYYGYRYYDPVTARLPSRDPIGERGGLNLYGMVGNDAVNGWDYLGLNPNNPELSDAAKARLAAFCKVHNHSRTTGNELCLTICCQKSTKKIKTLVGTGNKKAACTFRLCPTGGDWVMLAMIHSHPDVSPTPSPKDIKKPKFFVETKHFIVTTRTLRVPHIAHVIQFGPNGSLPGKQGFYDCKQEKWVKDTFW